MISNDDIWKKSGLARYVLGAVQKSLTGCHLRIQL